VGQGSSHLRPAVAAAALGLDAQQVSPQMAPKQRLGDVAISPLSEEKQTTGVWAKNDASDPERSLVPTR
jgi:hypothetical protein